MRYLALLYGAETAVLDPDGADAAEIARYGDFDEYAGDAVIGGEALAPTSAGVRLHHDASGLHVTEGVYAEGTEVIGGFYVLEADDLDGAIELARRIPAAEDGAVELRPLVEWFEERRQLPPSAGRYVALLAGAESEADQPGTAAWDAAVEAHDRFGRQAGAAVLGGGALQPASAGTVVQVRDGRLLVTEGVHAEATEIVGGLYLLWAADRQAAVDLAGQIPMAPADVVHLRPILELEDTDTGGTEAS